METFLTVLAVVVVILVVAYLFRSRSRRMKEAEKQSQTAVGSGLSTARDLFGDTAQSAPVESFHVVGEEARVTFAVPLDDEEDAVLNELLTGQAVEVVRHKRHSLPIDDVTEIVVLAGDPPRVIGRSKLPKPGELPPPLPEGGLSLKHVARDPFAAPFDEGTDHSFSYETAAPAPEDDLGPIFNELKVPKSLERGLRALGANPSEMSGPDFVLALLRMFGYSVTEQASPGSYLALKDGLSTYIATDGYQTGDHPEVDEGVIRRFLAEFGSSGAERGMLISDKYSPYMVYEVESNQPKVRFITRERIQRFIDSMAIG